MILFYLLCNVLFIPLFASPTKNATSSTEPLTKLLPSKESHSIGHEAHDMNITLISEGGAVIQNTPSLTLPKENHTNLLTLDKDIKDNSSLPLTSKVVPRKGVVYVEETTTIKNILVKNDISTENKTNVKDHNVGLPHKKNEHPLDQPTTKLKIEDNATNAHIEKVTKKPLILSYEGLTNSDQGAKVNKLKLPQIKSSSKPLADQLPSPGKGSGPATEVHPMSANRHPGMIIPIVITILVVPMFAVLAYMALRRGHEAWKNRHYKRMDFLLDGMYND